MLTTCPECELQVSDKAAFCPHCGYLMTPNYYPRKQTKPRKYRRLPNGFGQISEIKNRNLRKPFRAMVTVGKTPEGRPICKTLEPVGYFETYNEAYAALVDYNRTPEEKRQSTTVKEVYEQWIEEYSKTISDKNAATTRGFWRYCEPIENLKINDVKVSDLKEILNNGHFVSMRGETKNITPIISSRVKTMLNMFFDYAVENGYVEQNVARKFRHKYTVSSGDCHTAFSDEEIRTLWKNINDPYAAMIVIQCYSGWRPAELCDLRIENVDIKHWTFTGGSKTEAGKNRVVPIHSRIRTLVKEFYDRSTRIGSEYLFDPHLNYDMYFRKYQAVILKYGLSNHKPHDPRKHFVTMAKKYDVDEYAIKYMVGHRITDITEHIYTERSPEWLAREIEKIR